MEQAARAAVGYHPFVGSYRTASGKVYEVEVVRLNGHDLSWQLDAKRSGHGLAIWMAASAQARARAVAVRRLARWSLGG